MTMLAVPRTFALPRIEYVRHQSYRDVSPPIETLMQRRVSFEEPCSVNLADYWDYVEAIGYEAWLAEAPRSPRAGAPFQRVHYGFMQPPLRLL